MNARARVGLWIVVLSLGGAALSQAEQLTVNYTEPSAAGTLARTTVYWCRGSTCTDWKPCGARASDNGNGSDPQSVPCQIPLTAGTLPQTIRVRVTATDTSGNESAGATATHTFN